MREITEGRVEIVGLSIDFGNPSGSAKVISFLSEEVVGKEISKSQEGILPLTNLL